MERTVEEFAFVVDRNRWRSSAMIAVWAFLANNPVKLIYYIVISPITIFFIYLLHNNNKMGNKSLFDKQSRALGTSSDLLLHNLMTEMIVKFVNNY